MPESGSPHRLVGGRYQLLAELGRGGMGVVWRARDELIGRTVAVKELRPQPGPTGDAAISAERALREARAAGNINHPGVVAVFDVLPPTADDQAVYIVTELVDAPTLADLIQREGALPASRVRALAVGILDASEAAHAQGVVHRDIKPSNILVLDRDQVKLVDFGIAHAVGDTRLTRQGVMGSAEYLAPELFRGDEPTPAADLWSAGVTLWQAVDGRGPFDRSSTAAVIHAVLYDDLPAPRCGPPLATVIAGLLNRDPAGRMTSHEARLLLSDGQVASDSSAEPAMQPSPDHAAMSESTSTPTSGPSPGPAPSAETEPSRETWEQQLTGIHATGDAVPGSRSASQRDTGTADKDRADPTYNVSVPKVLDELNTVAQVSLPVLTAWLAWELPYQTLHWSIPVSIGAALLVYYLVKDVVRGPWAGALRFKPTGILIDSVAGTRSAVLGWERVERIVVAPATPRPPGSRPSPPVPTRLTIHMTAGTPSPEQIAPQLKGCIRRHDSGYTWTTGDIRTSAGTLERTISSAAPGHVVVTGLPAADKALPTGSPPRHAFFLSILLLAGVAAGSHYYRYQHPNPAQLADTSADLMAFNSDGTLLATADARTITLWDTRARQSAGTLVGHTKVKSLDFSPDGTILASGDDDGTIELWNVTSRSNTTTLRLGTDGASVRSIRFSPGGTVLAAVGSHIGVWRYPALGEPIAIEASVDVVAFSSDGRTIWSLDGKGKALFWDSATGSRTETLSGSRQQWSTFSGYSVQIRDAANGATVQTLTGNTDKIVATSWGPGVLFASSNSANSIRVWNRDLNRTLDVLDVDDSVQTIELSPDGQTLAYSTYSGGVWLWKFKVTG